MTNMFLVLLLGVGRQNLKRRSFTYLIRSFVEKIIDGTVLVNRPRYCTDTMGFSRKLKLLNSVKKVEGKFKEWQTEIGKIYKNK